VCVCVCVCVRVCLSRYELLLGKLFWFCFAFVKVALLMVAVVNHAPAVVCCCMTGWTSEDHVCVFALNFSPKGDILPPTLINSKLLPGTLLKAVTSVKLSASSRYVLMAYGVRENNEVQNHKHRFVC
jgi:hypothetical protein